MMPIVCDPKHPNTEWYEELCALAAIGELSCSEFEELQQHIAHCEGCRQLHAEFRRIAADDLGSLAILKKCEQAAGEVNVSIDEDELLTHMLERARQQPEIKISYDPVASDAESGVWRQVPYRHILDWLQRPALSYGAVALLLCAVATVVGFRVREVQLTPTLQELNAQVSKWKSRAQAAEANDNVSSDLLSRKQSALERLRLALDDMQTKYAALETLRLDYQRQVSQLRMQLEERTKEVDAAKDSETQGAKRLADLESRLQDLNNRSEQQERTIASLRNKLWEEVTKDKEAQNFDDAEAKQLFGARDLHIVDVYDVGSNGKTRRSYGRVYYVAKKLLIFYAFDLQDPRHNRVASGFQAWGYQQANDTSPRSLGLFTLDDVAENRWVLKVNNPKVLERIDAVFVTLEAPNGSPSPRGRRVLYANLAGPANHP